jgi:hypothetical protein
MGQDPEVHGVHEAFCPCMRGRSPSGRT